MKKKSLKILTCALMLGLAVNLPSTIIYTNAEALLPRYNQSTTIRGKSQVVISNPTLNQTLRHLLNKDNSDNLYTDDFVNNEHYKVITTIDPETNVETKTAEIRCLDLSYTNVRSLTELCQFEWPETLVSINLVGNGITNSDLPAIENFLQLTETSSLTNSSGNQLEVKSNLNNIIKKVNLNLNNISLEKLSTDELNNETLLYGIQNLNEDTSELYKLSDCKDIKYYIRPNDSIYLSYNIKYNENTYTYVTGSISKLIDSSGEYIVNISNPPLSDSAYFLGLNKTINLHVFEAKIRDDFNVERNAEFNIAYTDVIITGLHESYTLILHNAKTNVAGINTTSVTLGYKNKTKDLSLDFLVVDTISPIIQLEGYSVMYWRQFKPFTEPGYSATDSGDNITVFVEVTDNLDITTIGEYTIYYNVTDSSGNSATQKTRTIIVEESVLDTINIRSSNKDFKIGVETILSVKPAEGTPIPKYKNYEYKWYLNGNLFKTSQGDPITGQSTITYVPSSTREEVITVTLSAKQIEDNRTVYIDSSEFIINASIGVSDNLTIIIAGSIAVGLILICIATAFIIKAKNSKAKTSRNSKTKNPIKSNKKHKTNSNQTNPVDNIQVIRDYDEHK